MNMIDMLNHENPYELPASLRTLEMKTSLGLQIVARRKFQVSKEFSKRDI